LDILIESNNINEARKFLEAWGIILISIKEYPQNENSFGKIYIEAECN